MVRGCFSRNTGENEHRLFFDSDNRDYEMINPRLGSPKLNNILLNSVTLSSSDVELNNGLTNLLSGDTLSRVSSIWKTWVIDSTNDKLDYGVPSHTGRTVTLTH